MESPLEDRAQADDLDELARVRATLAEKDEEIARLRDRLADEQFGRELREVFALAVTAGTIATPAAHGQILVSLVETAATVIRARSAALFLLDEEAQELVFEVALGPKADEARKYRVPLGQGIAGLVALSAQPMAISGAQHDPRQASDIAAQIGYYPESILCVPLIYDNQVIGVLELLDKLDEPSFTPHDMELLVRFASQAAVGIEVSRMLRSLPALIGEVLNVFGDPSDSRVRQLRAHAEELAQRIEADPAYRRALELARLIQDISRQGEPASRACLSILRSFAEYSRSRTGSVDEYGATR
jgi:GAF domain-containing protein